jgi:Raf kinase inhibitor-like YbhB/YbcL family protein
MLNNRTRLSGEGAASAVFRAFIIAVAAMASMASCGSSNDDEDANPGPGITLTSASVTDGAIPSRYACYEAGVGLPLAWSTAPATTKSFAIIARDLDSVLSSVLGPFVHWVIYDIPLAAHELPDALPPQPELPNGIRQGINGFGKVGFAGPCPPGRSWHRYEFKVYALDTTLNLPSGMTREAVLAAMKGHVVATGSLIGRYKR